MAASNARMRLTVHVLPLAEENSHGPYRQHALAAFKGRKFALPVRLEDTFEQVWAQIEERYKRNYLTPVQASSFIIKVLQDAYDCDLDLSDTVSSIFEGEADPTKRLIKVVPGFVYRDFSVPVTSNLRPESAQKRRRELYEDNANKRRRLGEEQHELEEVQYGRNRPLPSTESERSGEETEDRTGAHAAGSNTGARRSESRGSVILVHNSQTGQDEFGPPLKDESPELGLPTIRTIPESEADAPRGPVNLFKKPQLPASRMTPSDSQHGKAGSPSPSPRRSSQAVAEETESLVVANGDHEPVDEDAIMEDDEGDEESEPTPFSEKAASPPASLESPKSTSPEESPLEPPLEPPRRTPQRKNVYDPPSPTPEPFKKPSKVLKTYGRSPHTPAATKTLVGLLNRSQSRSTGARNNQTKTPKSGGIGGKARAFQLPQPDEIVSTPQNERRTRKSSSGHTRDQSLDGDALLETTENPGPVADTPQSDAAPQASKLSKLKKPSRTSYQMSKSPVNARKSVSRSRKRNSFNTSNNDNEESLPADAHGSANTKGEVAQETRRSSPQIIIPLPKTQPASTKSRAGPNSTPQQSKPAHSDQPSSPAYNAVEASNLLQAFQKPVPRKSPVPSPQMPVTVNRMRESDPPNPRSTPMRSEVPLPDNVKHIAGNRTVILADKASRTEVLLASHVLGTKTNKPAPTVETGASYEAQHTPDLAISTKKRSRVPRSSTVQESATKRVNGVARDTPDSSEPKRAPRRSEVPLPENVRQRFSNAPATHTSRASRNEVVSPVSQKYEKVLASSEGLPRGVTPKIRKEDEDVSSITSSSEDESDEEIGTSEEKEAHLSDDLPRDGVAEGDDDQKLSAKEKAVIGQSRDNQNSREHTITTSNVRGLDREHTSLADARAGGDDAESLPDADEEQERTSEDGNLDMEESTAPDTADTSKSSRSPQKQESQPAPWNLASWSFGNSEKQEEHVENSDEEVDETRTQNSDEGASEQLHAEADAEMRSRSANSTRSSPGMARRPARFLSHSPTPEKSSSEVEEEEDDDDDDNESPAKAASLNATSDNRDVESLSSSSDSDSIESEEESNADDDIGVAEGESVMPSSSVPLQPTSQPQSQRTTRGPSPPTQLPVPPASQPLPRIAPLSQPLETSSFQLNRTTSKVVAGNQISGVLRPGNASQSPEASQIKITNAEARPPNTQPGAVVYSQPTPTNRRIQTFSQPVSAQSAVAQRSRNAWGGFLSLKDQLSQAKGQTASAQKAKNFKPGTQSLSSLAKGKQNGKKGLITNMSDSSDEESSSSSSSSDSDVGKQGSCSVA